MVEPALVWEKTLLLSYDFSFHSIWFLNLLIFFFILCLVYLVISVLTADFDKVVVFVHLHSILPLFCDRLLEIFSL